VLVTADPLAGVAAQWRAMWDLSAGPGAATAFEEQAAVALAGWRARQFELPDYYLAVTPAVPPPPPPASHPAAPHVLGPRASAPRAPAPHGPWWPPLDELLDTARHFYAGSLGGTGLQPSGPPAG